jgi:large subunit ribosomal protein L9
MKVIFQKNVPNGANAGDVKDVAGGYFRNFLLPQKYAQLATPAGIREAGMLRARMVKQHAKDKDAFAELLLRLQKEHILLLRKATEEGHLFGSVTESDIAVAFSEKGYHVDAKHIHVDAPIKELGTYAVTVRYSEDVTGIISLAVERGQ